MHGHLPLMNVFDSKEKKKISTPGLKYLETEIFGGGGENAQRSSFSIQVIPNSGQKSGQYDLVPHRSMKGNALNPGNTFDVKLSLSGKNKEASDNIQDNSGMSIEKLKALFMLTCYLGGLGKRARRGMGGVEIEKINGEKTGIPAQIDIQQIQRWIAAFSPFYQVNGDKITFSYSGASPQFGYIREIQLGKSYPNMDSVLSTISWATHDTKSETGRAYDPSMGHASGGRYASPVVASVVTINGAFRPIITTLNLAPIRDANQASLLIHEAFKKRIL